MAEKKNVGPGQQTLTLQQALNMGLRYHTAGRLSEAAQVYRQILNVDARQPNALHLLGVVAHQMGDNDKAVDLIEKALAVKPDYVDAYCNLGRALYALGRLDDAVAVYEKALSLKPDDADLHNSLGIALADLGRLDEAQASYAQALQIKPDFTEAHFNSANAFKTQGEPRKAIDAYRRVLVIRPDHAEAYANMALAYIDAHEPDEAVRTLQTGLETKPDSRLLNGKLINLLNMHKPDDSTGGPHVSAQNALESLHLSSCDGMPITDACVTDLYRQCHKIAGAHGVDLHVTELQVFRGADIDRRCERHMHVFETYDAIPEYCFGCFKVSVDVRVVVDLFKLLVLFDTLELPQDNTRKCFVEIRQGIGGAYKGLIYCAGLAEAEDVYRLTRSAVEAKIGNGARTAIKRGCSEFPFVHPDFAHVYADQGRVMSYDETWRDHEQAVDREWVAPDRSLHTLSYNQVGITLKTAAIMKNWLAYAAAIGDDSYLAVSGEPLEKLDIPERPPFARSKP